MAIGMNGWQRAKDKIVGGEVGKDVEARLTERSSKCILKSPKTITE